MNLLPNQTRLQFGRWFLTDDDDQPRLIGSPIENSQHNRRIMAAVVAEENRDRLNAGSLLRVSLFEVARGSDGWVLYREATLNG